MSDDETAPRPPAAGAASGGPIRVYLVDDHALFRSGVRAELDRGAGGEPEVVVAGEAGSVDEAVAGIGHLRPDVVLLDVHMPDGGGAEVLRRVRGAGPPNGAQAEGAS
ncbi:MAG: response regulator transcription factor, partial [Pseudonocardia sp.]|nr:response regulator transcription factor [Pseudonocardia sp.]